VRNSARRSARLPLAVLITKMLALVPVRAELATAPGLGQAWEAEGQARVWGWAEHQVRQGLVQVQVTCAPQKLGTSIILFFSTTPLHITWDLLRFPFAQKIKLP
jgi:hypothetical protein